jgi:3-mercaptopyruvate sulfurtransferase SseA
MRFILIMMLCVAFVGLTACNNANAPTAVQNSSGNSANKAAVANQTQNAAPKTDAHGHEDSAPRISLAEAKKEFDAGNAVFVDTRVETSFNQERIKGAINIPAEAVATRYNEIPKGKKIIAYCS